MRLTRERSRNKRKDSPALLGESFLRALIFLSEEFHDKISLR